MKHSNNLGMRESILDCHKLSFSSLVKFALITFVLLSPGSMALYLRCISSQHFFPLSLVSSFFLFKLFSPPDLFLTVIFLFLPIPLVFHCIYSPLSSHIPNLCCLSSPFPVYETFIKWIRLEGNFKII